MRQNKSFVIGVTGGVGAGKSTVLNYLENQYHAYIIEADEVARQLLEPGQAANLAIRKIYPEELFDENGVIRRKEMADYIYHNEGKRLDQNAIVFPLVKQRMIELIEQHQKNELIVIEAALLIEEHYDAICEELWYIYSSEENRRKRLVKNRGYSEDRIRQMFSCQLTEQEFREGCQVVIDNDGSMEETTLQIDERMNEIRKREEHA